MQQHRDQVLPFRCTPALLHRIEREATRRLNGFEVARLAIAASLRVLLGDEDTQPALRQVA